MSLITPLYVGGDGYQWTPDLAAGISLTVGSTPALGNWSEIVSATLDDLLILGMLSSYNSSTTNWTWIEYEIGLGVASSEYPIWQHKSFSMAYQSAVGTLFQQMEMFPRAVKVPAGERVSMRAASSASSFAISVSLCFIRTQDIAGSAASGGSSGGGGGGGGGH